MHRYAPAEPGDGPHAQILASGIAVPWALEAQRLLREDWNVHADVWSVTSWTRLRRDALAADEWNLTHPAQPRRTAYVTSRLNDAPGPVVAVSDWMRAVPDQIAPFVPGGWCSVGTDGFGLSDTRRALRRHFKIDAESIGYRVLHQLVNAANWARWYWAVPLRCIGSTTAERSHDGRLSAGQREEVRRCGTDVRSSSVWTEPSPATMHSTGLPPRRRSAGFRHGVVHGYVSVSSWAGSGMCRNRF